VVEGVYAGLPAHLICVEIHSPSTFGHFSGPGVNREHNYLYWYLRVSRNPQLLIARSSWDIEMRTPCCELKPFAAAEAEMGSRNERLIG